MKCFLSRVGRRASVILLVFFGSGTPARAETLIRLRVDYGWNLAPPRLEAVENETTLVRDVFFEINRIWSPCSIVFEPRLERQEIRVSGFTLRTLKDFFQLRRELQQPKALLVVVTDPWDAMPEIAQWGANAWTSAETESGHGVIVEWPHRFNAGLLAHELGHYLGLRHWVSQATGAASVEEDSTALMYPSVYLRSRRLSALECQRAREIANTVWAQARLVSAPGEEARSTR